MLQDLDYGRLENEFYDKTPREQDIVFCFHSASVLIYREGDSGIRYPSYVEIKKLAEDFQWKTWDERQLCYLFRLHDRNYFLWLGDCTMSENSCLLYLSVRLLRDFEVKEMCYLAMTAWHLFVWYKNNRFCGCCGERTVHDAVERMLRCPNCGNMIFPRISPAIIVAVTDGDRLLLTKYASRINTRYALIAGYTEIGETLEQTVQREVMEEVGLRVKNIRYYKSQPWGVDGNILMGFYCDLDGDDTIKLDRRELALGEWHDRNALPAKDDGMTLTREMIRVFEEGREPK